LRSPRSRKHRPLASASGRRETPPGQRISGLADYGLRSPSAQSAAPEVSPLPLARRDREHPGCLLEAHQAVVVSDLEVIRDPDAEIAERASDKLGATRSKPRIPLELAIDIEEPRKGWDICAECGPRRAAFSHGIARIEHQLPVLPYVLERQGRGWLALHGFQCRNPQRIEVIDFPDRIDKRFHGRRLSRLLNQGVEEVSVRLFHLVAVPRFADRCSRKPLCFGSSAV